MILKQYSRLRNSFPLHFYTISKRLAAPHEHVPVRASSEVQRRFSDYLFFKYDVNQQIEQELIELRKSAEIMINRTPIETLTRILLEIPMEAVAQSNMKIIKDLIVTIKDKNMSQQTEDICNEVERKMSGLGNRNQIFNSLFRVYRISQGDHKSIRNQKAQIILKNLRQDSQVKLSVEQISFFFQNLCEVNVLTPFQQQIRLNLLKRIRHKIPEIQIKLLLNVGWHLNALSQYDFIPVQLDIAQEIFNKITERDQEMTGQMIQYIFKSSQSPQNTVNLAQFYSKIVFSKLQQIKRYNSSESHELFHLIGVANSKIIPALQKYPQRREKYQGYILRYCQVNAKTLKRFQTTIDILLTLVSGNCISSTLVKFRDILKECKAKPSLHVLFNLAKLQYYHDYVLAHFQELSASPAQKIVLNLIPLMINNKASQRDKLKFIEKYLLNPQTFIQLIEQMQATSFPCLFQLFHTIFQGQVSKLMSNMEISSLGTQDQHCLLKYFISCHSIQSTNKKPIGKYLQRFHIDLIIESVQARLKHPSNQQIQRYLQIIEMLIVSQGPERKDILAINLLQRINVRFRSNSFNLSVILRYKKMFLLVTSKSDYFLSKQGQVQLFYSDLIRQFLINYNNYHNQYRLTGFYVAIIKKLVANIAFFDCDPETKHLLVKQGINCSLITNKNVHGIGKIDESCFTFIQIEKLKYFRYTKYQTVIKEINLLTLPLIILNKNLHHYLQSSKPIIQNLISSSTTSQLQKLIHQICFYPQPISAVVFDLFLKLVKELPKKMQVRTIQRYVFCNDFCLRYYFDLEQLQKVMLKLMQYFIGKELKIEDFQTHIVIIKLLKSFNLNKISLSEDKSERYPLTYINMLLERYKGHQQEEEEILYTLLFTNFSFNVGFDNTHIPKFLDARTVKVMLTSLLYLQHHFMPEQKIILLKKIMENVKNQLEKQDNMNIPTFYQYLYLKKTYKEVTQKFHIPENFLSKAPFSKAQPDAIQLLMSVSKFLNCPLAKIELHENQIYKLRSNYIIFVPADRQASEYEFSYLERLMKCIYERDILVTIVQRNKYSRLIPLNKVFKLQPLMKIQDWNRYYRWKQNGEERHSKGKITKEGTGTSTAKIARHQLSYIQQLKFKKTIMNNKLKK